MVEFLFALVQFICVIGLIYGALLCCMRIDWFEDLPADSFKCDPLTGHDPVGHGRAAAEQHQSTDERMRAL